MSACARLAVAASHPRNDGRSCKDDCSPRRSSHKRNVLESDENAASKNQECRWDERGRPRSARKTADGIRQVCCAQVPWRQPAPLGGNRFGPSGLLCASEALFRFPGRSFRVFAELRETGNNPDLGPGPGDGSRCAATSRCAPDGGRSLDERNRSTCPPGRSP